MTRFEAEIAALHEHRQGRTIALMLQHTKAGDIASRASTEFFLPKGVFYETFPTHEMAHKPAGAA
jgi:hypothetical protein